MSRKVWNIKFNRDTDFGKAEALAKELGVSPVTAILLINRGVTDAEKARRFLCADADTLYDPFLLKDMQKAVARVKLAEKRGERVVIYGDYDVDGVTSVAVLYTYLTKRGMDVFYHIPRRDGDGYGISENAIDEIAARGAKLMISVDCGITAAHEVEYAKERGIDTVVTDHHECHGDLPDACAVVNPRRPDCGYPFKELAGVGVAFNLACALEIDRVPNASWKETTRRVCEEYCDLIAIGTIADVMPLCDTNRYIVMRGLSALEEPARPGIAALCDAAAPKTDNSRKRVITSSYISFTIAPKINAAGRLDDATLAVRLMLSRDRAEADDLAARLITMNRERQEKENEIFCAAREKIRAEHDFENDPVIVVGGDGWHHGVIGIVASRVTESFRQPSIMVSFTPDGMGKGSGRSVKGFNLVDALAAVSDTLVKFGGHELAAGLSVERERFDDFRRAINEYARNNFTRREEDNMPEAECELDCDEITVEMIEEFRRLEPFGTTNPVPRFVMCNAVLCDVASVGGDRHTRLTIEKNGVRLIAMYFNMPAANLPFRRGEHVDLLFSAEVNEFMGRSTPQMTVRTLIHGEAVRDALDSARGLYDEISAGRADARANGAVPQHADFALLYRELSRRFNAGDGKFGAAEIASLLGFGSRGFIKVKLMTDILCELKLIDAQMRREASDDIYVYRVIPVKGKTNLDKSHIYNRIRNKNV